MKLLGFDIEIAKEVEGSDWDSQRPFGIAVAVALLQEPGSTYRDTHIFYGGPGGKAKPWPQMSQQQVCHLVIWLKEKVREGYTICTWNGTRFDFSVLAEESRRENFTAWTRENCVPENSPQDRFYRKWGDKGPETAKNGPKNRKNSPKLPLEIR